MFISINKRYTARVYVAVQVTMIRVTGGLIAAQQGGNSHALLYIDSSKGQALVE